ncbi:hypothetical protein FOL46_007160 [Perkinsus olseni]|nr:hypothetical protein FOL46_007160 [Perkinsus olseni]
MAVPGVQVTVFANSKAAARGHDTALTDLWFELIGCIRRHFNAYPGRVRLVVGPSAFELNADVMLYAVGTAASIRDEASGSHLRSAPPAIVILPADWNIFQRRTSTRAAISRWPSFRGRILDLSSARFRQAALLYRALLEAQEEGYEDSRKKLMSNRRLKCRLRE